MADFVLPTSAELTEVSQELLPNLMQQRRIFDIMPIRDDDAFLVMWEQEDNYLGLQAARGLNGLPGRVKRTGLKRYTVEPGIYGEQEEIDERTLTTLRAPGSFATPTNLDNLVMRRNKKLLKRELDRIEFIGWTLLATGTYSVANGNEVLATDSFTFQTYSAGVTWATSATATPLANFRAIQLLSRGYSVNFGGVANAYMNRTTFNQLVSNTNSADIYGRRTSGLGTFESLGQVNTLLTGDDLPNIIVYDGTYRDDTGAVQLFIPNNKVIVVGQRADDEPIMEYVRVRNANNPDMAPGSYSKIIDRGEDQVPRSIEVHRGHNGAPAVLHPSAVAVMTV